MSGTNRKKLFPISSEVEGLGSVLERLGGGVLATRPLMPEIQNIDFLLERPVVTESQEPKRLTLISGRKPLVIDPCDGTKVFSHPCDGFSVVDQSFRNLKADEPGEARPKTRVRVYEMTMNSVISDVFPSQSTSLTQHQIIEFAKKHRHWLRVGGNETLFPFESYSKRFIARLFFISDKLFALACKFENDGLWLAASKHWVVMPQLIE